MNLKLCRSSNGSPVPDTFQPCSSLEIILTGSFSLKACCKRWRRSKKSTSRPQLHVQDCRSRRITYYCFRQGSICDSEIIFRCATTYSCASCALKNFWKGKSTRMLVGWWEGTFSLISFLNNVIESAKPKKIYTCCNLALKPLLEFLNQIKCNRNEVTEEHCRWRHSSVVVRDLARSFRSFHWPWTKGQKQ